MSAKCDRSDCILRGCINPSNCAETESDSTPEGEAAYQQRRADDALTLLQQERDAFRAERADLLRQCSTLGEEIGHLRQGIDVLRSAYLAATAVRPGAKRPEIEDWLTADRQREIAREVEADRRRVDALPDYPDPGDR